MLQTKQKVKLKKFLISRIAELAGIEKENVSLTQPFSLMGLSSLDGIQLVEDINNQLGTSHSPTILFDYPNINELIVYLNDPSKHKLSFEEPPLGNNKAEFVNEPIAIVGMACNFPGAESLEAFEELLFKNKDAVTEVTSTRWPNRPKDLKAWGGFISAPDAFDNKLFDIFENEAKFLDPQQRKILELAWLSLEHAGYNPKDLANTNTGVYIGISSNDYSLARAKSSKVEIFDGLGGAHSIAANRISYFFNFHGPSWAVDTACSSSLIAVSQAVGHLRSSECNMALAGGVNILYTSHLTESFTKAGMLSPDGRCKTFSDDANGYVRGEGGGVIVLKRLSDAKRDGDKIWGLVKGFSYNQDGKSNGITAPNGLAQENVIKRALRFSRLEPHEIDYIEAHGTGTSLGDPIEFDALKSIFSNRRNNLLVGSVKTNIGHLEAAAGIAGILKVILAMKNKCIPAQLHFKKLNSKINAANANIEVVNKNINWDKLLRAGVSSFGFGGTNCHLILEGPYEKIESSIIPFNIHKKHEAFCINLNASSKDALVHYAKRIAQKIKTLNDDELENFCFEFNKKASYLNYRKTIVFTSKEEAISLLTDESQFKYIKEKKGQDFSMAFAFTGQGSQSPNMHINLYESLDIYRKSYDEVKKLFVEKYQVDFDETNEKIYETKNAQIALFCHEYAHFKQVESLGIKADIYLGHSLGEIIAYSCAEGMSLEHTVDLIYQRASFMQATPRGAMSVIFLNQHEVEKNIKDSGVNLSIAAINQEESIVVSGYEQDIKKFEEYLDTKELRYKNLGVKQGFHSYLMDDILDDFAQAIEHIEFLDPTVTVVSSVTGEYLDSNTVNATYWVNQIRKPTNFLNACKKLEELEIDSMLEIGPHPTLVHMLKANNKNLKETFYVQNRKEVALRAYFQFIKSLFEAGVQINYKESFQKISYIRMDVPTLELSKNEFNFFNKKKQKRVKSMKSSETEILQYLKNLIGDQLGVEENQVDTELPIINFGADSLILLNILDTLKDTYGVSIAIADVFQDLSTIKAISHYIAENIQETEISTDEDDFEIDFNDFSQGSGDSVEDIVNTQLAIMKKQLEVLGKANRTTAKKPTIDKSSLSRDFHSKSKGVLGGFGARSTSENFSATVSDDWLENFINLFVSKTKTSKEHSERYRKQLSDNRVSAGFRPNLKEMVYPIIWKRAKGAYFWDLDGNKYIDFTMGFGVNLFGHSPDFIQNSIANQLEQGMALGPQSDMAGVVAKKFCELTGNERVAFLNSGTEAIMTAIRLARAATKRELIVIFEGSYHGTFDGVLGRTNSKNMTVPVAAGVPDSLTDGLIVLEYGSDEAINFINQNGSQIAAVLVESVQSRYPEHRPKDFIKKLREITHNSQTALIFDEVITGLRAGVRGAQAYYGVKADIGVYGKVLGGGMPIGAVAGDAKFLDFVDGGHWNFGDDSMPINEMTFFAGTFCKHSLAMAASYETLKEVESKGEKLFEDLNLKTKRLADELNEYFKENNLPIEIVYFSSLFRFKFSGNIDLLFYMLNYQGIYIWEGRNMFISTAHSDADINYFISSVKSCTDELIAQGYFFDSKSKEKQLSSSLVVKKPMVASHLRFSKMTKTSNEGALASKLTIAIELEGNYKHQELRDSIEHIANRHESLKSHYNIEKNEIIFNSFQDIKVGLLDFREIDSAEDELNNFLNDSAKNPIDLNQKCVDVDLVLISETRCVIAFSGHHIALDGLSLAMLSFDIANTYSQKIGTKKSNKLKEISYQEFLDDYDLSSEKKQKQLEYWKNQYKELPKKLFKERSFTGSRISIDLDLDLSKKVKFYGYKKKSSLMNTLLLTLLKKLEHDFDAHEFTVGIPMAGHKNISDSMVGNCVNLLPFKCKIDPKASDEDMISNIKTYQLESFKYSEIPFEEIKESLGEDIIEVVLNVEPINELPKFGDLKTKLLTFPSLASEYPIYINAMKVEDEINLTMDYQFSAFENEKLAKDFLDSFVGILKKLVES